MRNHLDSGGADFVNTLKEKSVVLSDFVVAFAYMAQGHEIGSNWDPWGQAHPKF